MNWTHKIIFESLETKPAYWFDVNNPNLCEEVVTGRQYINNGEGGWMRWWKGYKDITWEEVDFSLENE